MSFVKARSQRFRGVSIPRRRFTIWAALYFALFVCLPLLGLTLFLDLGLYFFFDRVFGSCYALFCFLG